METMVCKECLVEKDINDFRLYKKNNSRTQKKLDISAELPLKLKLVIVLNLVE